MAEPGSTVTTQEPRPDVNPARAADDGAKPRRWLRLARAVFQPRNVIILAVVVIIAYLAAVPLFYLVHGTFVENGDFTLAAFGRAYAAVALGEMVLNSFIFAGGSALLAMIIGTFLAYVTIRTDAPFPTLVFAASMVPLIIPGVLYTISWILLSSENIGILNQLSSAVVGAPVFNAFSMPGMIWVEGTHNAPLVYLFMVAAFRSMDPAMEESALLSGATRMTMIRRIALPLVRPALAGATLIMVVRGLEGFEVPALLGVPTGIFVFTSRIFFELQNFPIDTAAAGSLSLSLLGFAAIGVFLTSRFGSGKEGAYSTVTGKGFRPHPIELRGAKPFVGVAVVLYFLVTALLPIGVLLYTSMLPFVQEFSLDVFSGMSLQNYGELFNDPAFPRATMNSLMLGIGAATAVAVLSAVAAWLVVRTKVPGRQLVDQLAFLPLVVPGIVLGLAVSFVYLRNPLPFQVYGTMLILLFAYITRFLPYGMRYGVSSIEQVSGELEESAYVAGASWWQTFRRVLVPLILPGLLAGWLYTFIISVRELSSSIVLYTPGNEVLSILTWNLYEDGQLTTVAALGVVMIGGLTVIVTLVYGVGTRFGLRER